MDYKLAKSLEDAGFPQDCKDPHDPNDSFVSKGNGSYDLAHDPTLEELIEACGEDFIGVMRIKGMWYSWAKDSKGFVFPKDEESGTDTPIEAVAKLWLELNKK